MNTIDYADFEKVAIKTGTIIAANDFPNAKNPPIS